MQTEVRRMKLFYRAGICLMLLCIGACGPKEVGHGAATSDYSYGPDPGQELRYPMDGNRIQQRLYMLNQPQTMDAQQRIVRDSLARTSPQEDPAHTKPKQVSPFRE